MKITYHGTAAAEGIPALFCQCDVCQRARQLGGKSLRTRSQVRLNDDLLLDFGPDTFMHTLTQDLDLSRIEHVLITHCHEDHLYLEDLVYRAEPYGHLGGMMHVYGNDTLQEMYHTFVKKVGMVETTERVLTCHELEAFRTYAVGNYRVTPLLADHNVNEKCFIYIVEDEDGKCLLYANDTGYFKDETWTFLEGYQFDLVSLDCTHVFDPYERNHMGLAANVKVKERLLAMNALKEHAKVIVTHFSHNHGGIHEDLEEAVKNHDMLVAYDGMKLEI